MKLDLEYVRKVSDHLHQLYREAGGYNRDEHVYSVRFEPDDNHVMCHISWPYFRNLVANETSKDCDVDVSKAGAIALHLAASVQGIEVTACVFKDEIVDMLKEHLGSVPEDKDALALFDLWQNLTGWGLSGEEKNNG